MQWYIRMPSPLRPHTTWKLTRAPVLQTYAGDAMSLALDSPSNATSSDGAIASSYESNCQQLREYIQRLRSHPANAHHADATYKDYSKIRDSAKAICEALLGPQSPLRVRATSLSGTLASLSLTETASLNLTETRTSVSSRSSNGLRSPYIYEQHLDLIRTWLDCLENLLKLFETSLLDTYKEWEPQASPGMVDQLFNDKKFRKTAIARMRNASIAKTVSANLDFFPKYDIRFRDYDKLKIDLNEMRSLLQNGETGITPDRTIEEIGIAPRGDTILQFANKADGKVSEEFPVLRFRVSSHMLAEASPIFSRIFNNDPALLATLDEEASLTLPPPPSPFVCKDGTEVKLFRMPQLELNVNNSLEILLHAAHMHNDEIPREIEFETFVAIAEVCMEYQCTSPLELSVEYQWLPQWLHKASEDMPDGFLLISYVFGLRRLFTRMTKTAILNIADEKEIESKAWPQGIKDKVKAVRAAKVNQVYACCKSLVEEYLRCPSPSTPVPDNLGLVPTAKPRCVKGSHACDAASLGWLLMLFNELHVLPQISHPAVVLHRPPPPRRSLGQLVDCLRLMASPPQIHDGLCDFVPTFRSAINDVYNSVSGLTLFDVAGKHGWALSKNKSLLPQAVFRLGAPLVDPDVTRRTTEDVALMIMKQLDNLEDVYSAALVNRSFYDAFKRNELVLLRVLLGKTKNPERWTINGASNKQEARIELKALRMDQLKTQKAEQAAAPYEGEEFDTVNTVEIDMAGLSLSGESPTDDGLKMTREEAERILWPSAASRPDSTTPAEQLTAPKPSRSPSQEAAEKFRACDPLFSELEEKHLVINENKNLSVEHYQRIGLKRLPETVEDSIGRVADWI